MSAYVWRFTTNCRAATGARKIGTLQPEELADAEHFLITYAQQEEFLDERRELQSGRPVAKGSPLAALYPWLDEDALIRCNSWPTG